MKKLVVVFIISTLLLSCIAFAESIYILKCITKISQLENLTKDLSQENQDLDSSNEELKEKYKNLEEQQEKKHPIEIKHQECMKRQNYTTAAMRNCTYVAVDEWYKEIDTSIVLLKNNMTKQQYNLLVDSQDKWKAYKETESKLFSETIGTFTGTYYTVVLAGKDLALVETRAKDLASLYRYMSNKDIMKY